MDSCIIQDLKLPAPLRIGAQDTYAHLDTGATGNMLATQEADHWEQTGERTMSGAMGEQQVKPGHIGRLEFLGQPFDHVPAIVFDATEYLAFPPQRSPQSGAGVGTWIENISSSTPRSARSMSACEAIRSRAHSPRLGIGPLRSLP